MKFTRTNCKVALGFLAAVPVLFWNAAAAQAPSSEGVPVPITVTAMAKEKNQEPPPLSKEDFLIYQSKDRRPVLSAVAQKGPDNKLDLYIVVDDSIDSAVTLNYSDIGGFVRELPSTARVGVLYTTNGTIRVERDLTDDREAALKALRIPLGRTGAAGGIYLSLADLAKRLPPQRDRRYAILFLSSGIDTFRGVRSTTPGLNPDLDTAINRLNRSAIAVYAIYVSPAAHFSRSFFLVSNGQSCLSRLADETGGEAFFQGTITPISMKPFLEEIGRHLANQYLVWFAAKPGKKSGYAGIKVRTEVSGVELDSQSQVYISAGGEKQ